MQDHDREDLLWQLGESHDEPSTDGEAVSDARLAAYRRGELADDEARRVERRLIASPEDRQRLEALAEVAPETAPESIRQQLIERFADRTPDQEFSGSSSREGTVPGVTAWSRFGSWRALAAAALLVLVVSPWVLRQPATPPIYDVRIEALREERAAGETDVSTHLGRAYAETPVTITATVATEAVDGVEVGVYGVRGDQLRRLDGLPAVERRSRAGVESFEAPAALWVGSEPGEFVIYVVIAWRGELVSEVELDPDTDPSALLAEGGDNAVHRLTLRLLD